MAHKLVLGGWCEELVAGDEEAAEAAGTGVNPEADIASASGAAYQPYHHNVVAVRLITCLFVEFVLLSKYPPLKLWSLWVVGW